MFCFLKAACEILKDGYVIAAVFNRNFDDNDQMGCGTGRVPGFTGCANFQIRIRVFGANKLAISNGSGLLFTEYAESAAKVERRRARGTYTPWKRQGGTTG